MYLSYHSPDTFFIFEDNKVNALTNFCGRATRRARIYVARGLTGIIKKWICSYFRDVTTVLRPCSEPIHDRHPVDTPRADIRYTDR